ncbi:MAG: DUF4372 domain-containing protein [Candidimonas sp.]|nr:MAG: DUF4372 domain-containing protein [Candidimonas sp.]TAM22434.1 MAG: DUF4372 domain-containing protein [Candidimonas sp.]
MYSGRTMFAQIMEFVPWTSFSRVVTKYSGEAKARSLTGAEQFRAKPFARLYGARHWPMPTKDGAGDTNTSPFDMH